MNPTNVGELLFTVLSYQDKNRQQQGAGVYGLPEDIMPT